MLQYFHGKLDVFTLKDLEKDCAKETGITTNTIKDTLQALVDDALVETDRIGPSAYFWSFPSKASVTRKRTAETQRALVKELSAKRRQLESSVQAAAETRRGLGDDPDSREAQRNELVSLRATGTQYAQELKSYATTDPELVHEQQRKAAIARTAANRWTDNVYAIKSWSKKKFNMDTATIDRCFQIPPDLDYVPQ